MARAAASVRARSAALAVLVLAVGAGAPAGAAPEPPTTAFRHVRGVSDEAVRMLGAGRSRSATIASLLDAIEQSDLIVMVDIRRQLPIKTGALNLVTIAGDLRVISIRVSRNQPTAEHVMALLAHELRHAVELSAAPEVRDVYALARFYERLGWMWRNGGYETTAACETEAHALRELRASNR